MAFRCSLPVDEASSLKAISVIPLSQWIWGAPSHCQRHRSGCGAAVSSTSSSLQKAAFCISNTANWIPAVLS